MLCLLARNAEPSLGVCIVVITVVVWLATTVQVHTTFQATVTIAVACVVFAVNAVVRSVHEEARAQATAETLPNLRRIFLGGSVHAELFRFRTSADSAHH